MDIAKMHWNTDWTELLSIAEKMMSPCRMCPRKCGADRKNGMPGFCRALPIPSPSKAFITYGEEEFLNPAYMLYFPCCNMRCAYCSNREFVHDCESADIRSGDLSRTASEIDAAFEEGRIKVLQVLGGEATVSMNAVLAVLSRLKSGVPVVWNSNFYFSAECFDLIDSFADYYVADLKFGNDTCAEKLSDTHDYLSTVIANMRRVPHGKMLIRHLQLGGHLECCTLPLLKLIADEFCDVPAAFHDLIPDKAGRTRIPDQSERQALERKVNEYGIRRVFSHYAPGTSAKSPNDLFSGEIIIRRDGSIVIQDVPERVKELIAGIAIGKEEAHGQQQQ